MKTVTLTFLSTEDAKWFAKMARKTSFTKDRLGRLDAAIMQDALAKALVVEGPCEDLHDTKPSRQPSNT
jgi:hypothetical protein